LTWREAAVKIKKWMEGEKAFLAAIELDRSPTEQGLFRLVDARA
jgi:hypothetical protein